MSFLSNKLHGLLLCFAIAVPAAYLGKMFPIVGAPVFAILLGLLLAGVPRSDAFCGGITFTSKKILQYAIILLGFGMNLFEIFRVGSQSLLIILSTIGTALTVSYAVSRIMKIDHDIATLVGVGSSICGGSAIAAAAPVIKASDEDIAQSISVIFLFNVIAAFLFPTLGAILGFNDMGFGMWAGTAINDTSSVTAAAQAWDGIHGSNTLDAAAIVKLTRTLAIIPITLVLAFVRTRRERHSAEGAKVNLKKIFPFFVLFFLLASVVTTVFHLPAAVTSPLKEMSKFFIVMAMAAIGLNTNIIKLVKTGGKPIFMGLCCWIGIAGVSLLMQHLLGIW